MLREVGIAGQVLKPRDWLKHWVSKAVAVWKMSNGYRYNNIVLWIPNEWSLGLRRKVKLVNALDDIRIQEGGCGENNNGLPYTSGPRLVQMP